MSIVYVHTCDSMKGEIMLTTEEIRKFLNEDAASEFKAKAVEGQRYYDGKHDILNARIFYWNADGELVEDKERTNAKIPHPFFTELVDQATQYILSGSEKIICSDDSKLQKHLDIYFNKDENFKAELQEAVTDMQSKGCAYMYARHGEDDRLHFECADCIGVVEVDGRFTEDRQDQYIWKYEDRIDIDGHTQFKILVIDDQYIWYYKQEDEGEIVIDTDAPINPRPHKLYRDKDGQIVKKVGFKMLPLFRLDNNKKRRGYLDSVKPNIDDYDIMASSLTNNLADFDTPLYVVRGYDGDDLDKLQTNLRTKKVIGVDEDGGIEVHTVDVPYQARMTKLEHDEKCIYKFGMGLDRYGLKDTNATTNIAIKTAYSQLELRCNKMIIQIKQFLRGLLVPVIDEINEKNETDFQLDEIYFDFEPEIMANEQENAQVKLIEAQKEQTRVNTLLGLATYLDNETLMSNICSAIGVDYEEISNRLPDLDEGINSIAGAQNILDTRIDPRLP